MLDLWIRAGKPAATHRRRGLIEEDSNVEYEADGDVTAEDESGNDQNRDGYNVGTRSARRNAPLEDVNRGQTEDGSIEDGFTGAVENDDVASENERNTEEEISVGTRRCRQNGGVVHKYLSIDEDVINISSDDGPMEPAEDVLYPDYITPKLEKGDDEGTPMAKDDTNTVMENIQTDFLALCSSVENKHQELVRSFETYKEEAELERQASKEMITGICSRLERVE